MHEGEGRVGTLRGLLSSMVMSPMVATMDGHVEWVQVAMASSIERQSSIYFFHFVPNAHADGLIGWVFHSQVDAQDVSSSGVAWQACSGLTFVHCRLVPKSSSREVRLKFEFRPLP